MHDTMLDDRFVEVYCSEKLTQLSLFSRPIAWVLSRPTAWTLTTRCKKSFRALLAARGCGGMWSFVTHGCSCGHIMNHGDRLLNRILKLSCVIASWDTTWNERPFVVMLPHVLRGKDAHTCITGIWLWNGHMPAVAAIISMAWFISIIELAIIHGSAVGRRRSAHSAAPTVREAMAAVFLSFC